MAKELPGPGAAVRDEPPEEPAQSTTSVVGHDLPGVLPPRDPGLQLDDVSEAEVLEGCGCLLGVVPAPAVQEDRGLLVLRELSLALPEFRVGDQLRSVQVAVLLPLGGGPDVEEEAVLVGDDGLLELARVDPLPTG